MPVATPHRNNELKHGTPDHHHDEEEFMTLGPMSLLSDKVQGPSQVSPAGLTFLISVLFYVTIYG